MQYVGKKHDDDDDDDDDTLNGLINGAIES